MNSYVLLTEKAFHKALFESLKRKFQKHNWFLIDSKDKFTNENLARINPTKIFIPHWSYIISAKIYDNFECVVFHMTDLPYGRGGSPLQNLIVRGHKKTMISALRVEGGIDTGKIYLKKPLSLLGTADDIFLRSTEIIEKMIVEIIEKKPVPVEQQGEPVNFKRRKREDGNLNELESLESIYDYIRMLDAEGYPPAFLETDKFQFEFSKASLKNNEITAHVRILKK